jgi:cellulose synthase operon protein B
MRATTNGKTAVSIIICLGMLLGCISAPATYAAASADVAKTPSGTLTLASLMPARQQIRLRYTADEFTLYVPVSPRSKVKSALLHLQLTNSISLLRERSQLVVRLNGRVLAQVPLNPAQPETSVDIRLPVALLKPGYNQLTFSVAQHYTLRCEDPSAPELWTEIDTLASTLTFDSELTPLQPRLSDLAQLFDPKLAGDQGITIVTASPLPMRDDQLQWGMLVAQGAALRLQYAPLRVRQETAERAGAEGRSANFPGLKQDGLKDTDSALIGTKEELAPYVAKSILDGISGGFLGVYALDADPRRFVLVVSGTTPAEVVQAARSFAFLNFPYPDTPSMLVSAIEYAKLPDYAGKNTLTQPGIYRFSQLDFRSATVRGNSVSSLVNEEHIQNLEIEVVMPADLFAHEDLNVDMILHFAYGAGLRRDSVLNIMLNERFERAIALDQQSGAAYQKYQIAIPLRSFQPGVNKIRFAPRMMPLITGECLAIQTENLQLTLFEDSYVNMPKSAHFVSMPNLRLLVRTGFPYNVKTDGSAALVHVASNDSKTIAAAWMLIGKLAQRNGYPLHQLGISFAAPGPDNKDLIVVGITGKIDAKLLQGAPLEFGKFSRIPYPVAAEQTAEDWPRDWLERLLPGTSRPLAVGTEGDGGNKSVVVSQASELVSHALAMQYRSPGASGKTATALMAANEELLYQGTTELIKPAIWNDLQGNVVIWNKGAESVAWQKAGGDYTVGAVSVTSRLEFYFSRYPWLWFIMLLVLTLLLAWVTTRLLRRFRLKNHPRAPERRGDTDVVIK